MESDDAYSMWGKPVWNTSQLCIHTLQASKRHVGTLQGCVVQRCILIRRVLGPTHSLAHWGKICFGSNTLDCCASSLSLVIPTSIFFTLFKCFWFSDGTSLMILLQLLWKYVLKVTACRQVMALKIFFVLIIILIAPPSGTRNYLRQSHSHTKLSKSFATACSVAGFHSESQF